MSARTVLVTGGSGKIGRLLIARFLAEGRNVAFTARNPESLEQTLGHFEEVKKGSELTGIIADFTEANSIPHVLKELRDNDIAPDGLVNNARSLENLAAGAEGNPSRAQWSNEFQIGVVAAFELAMGLARQKPVTLRSVVNVSSMYGVIAPNPGLYDNPADIPPIHYGVTKAALIHLTRELAVRLAPDGVRVNAVCYGGVEGRASERFKARYAAFCPLGGMLQEENVAGPVVYLLSDDAGALTGHNLVADGGWTAL